MQRCMCLHTVYVCMSIESAVASALNVVNLCKPVYLEMFEVKHVYLEMSLRSTAAT